MPNCLQSQNFEVRNFVDKLEEKNDWRFHNQTQKGIRDFLKNMKQFLDTLLVQIIHEIICILKKYCKTPFIFHLLNQSKKHLKLKSDTNFCYNIYVAERGVYWPKFINLF